MANLPVPSRSEESLTPAGSTQVRFEETAVKPRVSQPFYPATLVDEPDRRDTSFRLDAGPQMPVRVREILAVVLVVALADLTVYRGQGYAGLALLFAATPALLAWGTQRPSSRAGVWLMAGMLVPLAVKLAWCGHAGLVAAGFVLIVAQAMALNGLTPHILEMIVYGAQTLVAGWHGLLQYARTVKSLEPARLSRDGWLSIVLPLIALVAFGSLFLLANPDLVNSFTETLRHLLDWLTDALQRFAPRWTEFLFWMATAWFTIGLLRPVLSQWLLAILSGDEERTVITTAPSAESSLYAAFRNTLVVVIVLFACYLVFEFKTLWLRQFPKGFYYAGYAHKGAAWLTAALALSTVVLSLVFRGSVLGDPRLPSLRKLAWIWSAENLILALSVYHRMQIYVDFNGMTRMRTVGLFGITAVLVGFLLVVWKIMYGRNFVWLLRRHLWTLAIALYLLAVTPVDPIVHGYNVRRMLRGDLAPVVQVSVHPISSEGVLVLHPLVSSRDATIREGIRALLAQRAEQLENRLGQHKGWTAFQLADRLLLRKLQAVRGDWEHYTDRDARKAALKRFHDYAYQWY